MLDTPGVHHPGDLPRSRGRGLEEGAGALLFMKFMKDIRCPGGKVSRGFPLYRGDAADGAYGHKRKENRPEPPDQKGPGAILNP